LKDKEMGLKLHDIKFLLAARERGVDFNTTLTLGRQEYMEGADSLSQYLFERGLVPTTGEALNVANQQKPYADWIFRLLGAETVSAMDHSSYEGASAVHDMNAPIPDTWKESFSVVYDGGTLEHVFHYSIALKNAMELVRPGGHLLIQTPANNFFGHAFYQLSPELFFRALSTENGYRIERMIALEDRPGSAWYQVTDPAHIRSRVELVNSNRVILLIQARRDSVKPIFEQIPQQSDYFTKWQDTEKGVVGISDRSKKENKFAHLGNMTRRIARRLTRPARVSNHLKHLRRQRSFENREYFSPVETP
jgi:hypothetical protein